VLKEEFTCRIETNECLWIVGCVGAYRGTIIENDCYLLMVE